MQMAGQSNVFFGYPSEPWTSAETIATAVKALNEGGTIHAVSWEDLRVPGRLLIEKVVGAIDASDASAFDITQLNHNVMFELGYAIGSGKAVWLLLDESNEAGARLWREIRILTTIEYSSYINSGHIVAEFWKALPHQQTKSIFDSLVPNLEPANAPTIFTVPSIHPTEADRRLRTRLAEERDRGARVFDADPTESGVQPLVWYAQRIYASHATVVHLCPEDRKGWAIHNARGSLVAGLAHGMGRKVLMVAEAGHEWPIDYQDMLREYHTAVELEQRVNEWVLAAMEATYEEFSEASDQRGATKLAVELKALRLGEHVAENERDTLPGYFIPTAAFDAVLEKQAVIFIGRKGSGKTANLLEAARELGKDARNLVTVIQPPSYEMESVVELFRDYYQHAEHGFLVESLWKFLVYSEIAQAAHEDIRKRPVPPEPDSPEGIFLQFFEANDGVLNSDFAVRLESAVATIRALPVESGVARNRARISEALHDGLLRDLRKHLGAVLLLKNRVAVLVDNLDKTWSKQSDVDHLALFLLGLLQSVEAITDDFRKADYWRSPVTLTLAVFLRTDIYEHVARAAREPDKLPVQRLAWTDPELLLRVIEERFLANQREGTDPSHLWETFFCEQINGIPTRDYIIERILPRPRDLIQFCNAAIGAAVNHRHSRVEPGDVRIAEAEYSQFALESLKVENGITVEEIENVLYEFIGQRSVLPEAEVRQAIERAGVAEQQVESVQNHLIARGFLALEVGDGDFRFVHELSDLPKIQSHARNRRPRGPIRYSIHPAFCAYLEIGDPPA